MHANNNTYVTLSMYTLIEINSDYIELDVVGSCNGYIYIF